MTIAPIEVLVILVAAGAIALAVVASIRVLSQGDGLGRASLQLAFVWLVPLLGPLLAIGILRKSPEHHDPSADANESQPVEGRMSHRSAATPGPRGTREDHLEIDSDH